MANINYRTIDVDSLDSDAPVNFPLETLLPSNLPPSIPSSDAANIAAQIRQLLRSGDSEGALRHALDTAPLGGDDRAKEVHLATVVEVLQGIRQAEMMRVLEGVCSGEGGVERGDCLMKYLYVFFELTPLFMMATINMLTLDLCCWWIGTEAWLHTRAGERIHLRRSLRCHRRVPDSRRYRVGILAKVAVGNRWPCS